MPTSIREQVNVAIKAKLSAITGFVGLKVERERDAEIENYPSIVFFDTGQDADDSVRPLVFYDLRIEVEVWVQASTGEAAAAALNDLAAQVTKAMTADPSLSSTAIDVREGGDIQEIQFDGSKAIKAGKLSFTVQYQTRSGDPYAFT